MLLNIIVKIWNLACKSAERIAFSVIQYCRAAAFVNEHLRAVLGTVGIVRLASFPHAGWNCISIRGIVAPPEIRIGKSFARCPVTRIERPIKTWTQDLINFRIELEKIYNHQQIYWSMCAFLQFRTWLDSCPDYSTSVHFAPSSPVRIFVHFNVPSMIRNLKLPTLFRTKTFPHMQFSRNHVNQGLWIIKHGL